jgi:hypothetical protein
MSHALSRLTDPGSAFSGPAAWGALALRSHLGLVMAASAWTPVCTDGQAPAKEDRFGAEGQAEVSCWHPPGEFTRPQTRFHRERWLRGVGFR